MGVKMIICLPPELRMLVVVLWRNQMHLQSARPLQYSSRGFVFATANGVVKYYRVGKDRTAVKVVADK